MDFDCLIKVRKELSRVEKESLKNKENQKILKKPSKEIVNNNEDRVEERSRRSLDNIR